MFPLLPHRKLHPPPPPVVIDKGSDMIAQHNLNLFFFLFCPNQFA